MKDTQNCLTCQYTRMTPTEIVNASLQRKIKRFRCKKGFNILSGTAATMYCASYKKKGETRDRKQSTK